MVGDLYSADEMGAVATWLQWAFILLFCSGPGDSSRSQALHKYHTGFSQPHYRRQLVGLQ